MSGSPEDFPDDAIRNELKRMVERSRDEAMAAFEQALSEARNTEDGTAEKRQQITERLKRAGELASTRYDEMISFIDRNA